MQPDDLKVLFSVDTTTRYNKRVFEPYIYAFRLQVLCGFRLGEVGGLKKSDRVGDTVYIRRAININGEVTQGKNDNAVRSFVLSDLGKVCWDKQAALSPSDELFPDFDERKYRMHLARYCQANGMTIVTPYELRHTAFSIMQTLPEGLVKAVGGHSKNMDTFDIYGHEVQGDMQLTAELLQERFADLLSNSKIHRQNTVKPDYSQKN